MALVSQVLRRVCCLTLALGAAGLVPAGPPETRPAETPDEPPADSTPVPGGRCRPTAEKACVLTLHGESAGSTSASCSDEAWRPHLAFQQARAVMDRNGDGWAESVIQLDLDPALGCQCAVLRLHFGGEVKGFAFHLGDSASNDGYGGDAGTDPVHYAEAHISSVPSGLILAVHSASGEILGPDPLVRMPLPELAGHFMDVEVCHQSLLFSLDGDSGRPGSIRLRSLHGRELLAVAGRDGESGSTASPTMDPWIYLAFNRVVHRRNDAPHHDRFGRGLERVEIHLTP